jgi:protein phosphatase inhibitor 2
LTWDEEIIAEHNKDRGTRQKITEPDTPYAYHSDHEEDDDEIGDSGRRDAGSHELRQPAAPKMEDSMAELNAKLEYHSYVTSQETPELALERMADEKKKKSFADKRAEHYNEFKLIQALRARQQQEDEEEEEEEKMRPSDDTRMDTSE